MEPWDLSEYILSVSYIFCNSPRNRNIFNRYKNSSFFWLSIFFLWYFRCLHFLSITLDHIKLMQTSKHLQPIEMNQLNLFIFLFKYYSNSFWFEAFLSVWFEAFLSDGLKYFPSTELHFWFIRAEVIPNRNVLIFLFTAIYT